MSGNFLGGRCVLVTGAGGALGGAVALDAARRGARLILVGRTVSRLEAVYDRIAAEGLLLPFLCPLDFATAEPAAFEQLATSLAGQVGALHGLVHAAADRGTPGPIADIEPTEWTRVLRVNLDAPFHLTRALLPRLGTDGGCVLFVVDRTGRAAFRGAYGVAKQGLDALSRTLAAEWSVGGRVRVNRVSPPPFGSALRRRAFPGEHPDTVARVEHLAPRIVEWLDPACFSHDATLRF